MVLNPGIDRDRIYHRFFQEMNPNALPLVDRIYNLLLPHRSDQTQSEVLIMAENIAVVTIQKVSSNIFRSISRIDTIVAASGCKILIYVESEILPGDPWGTNMPAKEICGALVEKKEDLMEGLAMDVNRRVIGMQR